MYAGLGEKARLLFGGVVPFLFLSIVLAGCEKKAEPPLADAGIVAPDSIAPPSQHDVPTTDGTIAAGNLNAQISTLEADAAAHPSAVEPRLALGDLVALRGTFASRIADYERALDLAESAVRDAPGKPEALLARAAARSTFHLFADAMSDLDEAERHGASAAQTRSSRASILQGQGNLDAALPLRHADSAAKPDIRSLGAEAATLGEMGQYDDAAKLFQDALTSYRGVYAFPVAWLLFQEGSMWERAGNVKRARAFYAAAHERLPMYAHALSHLALLESAKRGVELLSNVAADSDDPEIEMVLGQRMRDAGDAIGAAARFAHVGARYDALVAKHREAFAEHAGWFWLDEGKNPAKALELAKQNLVLRKTGKAYELAVLAALSAGARDDACAIGTEGGARPHASEMLRGIVTNACAKH